jgi:hypothetical protein
MKKLINVLKMSWIVPRHAVQSCIFHFCNPNGRWLKDIISFDENFNKAKALGISRYQYGVCLDQDIEEIGKRIGC